MSKYTPESKVYQICQIICNVSHLLICVIASHMLQKNDSLSMFEPAFTLLKLVYKKSEYEFDQWHLYSNVVSGSTHDRCDGFPEVIWIFIEFIEINSYFS